MADYIEQMSKIKLMLEEDRAYQQRDRKYNSEQRELITLELNGDQNASEYATFEKEMEDQDVKRVE